MNTSTVTVTKPPTDLTAAEVAEIRNLPATVTDHVVLDHANVTKHHDWRQIASEIVGLAAAFTAAAGAGGLATGTLIEVSKALAVVAGALVGLLVWLLAEVRREGRRWVYAEPDEPTTTSNP